MLRSSLREGDRAELAVAKLSPTKAIWRCFRHSLYCKTVLVDGELAAMWGVGGTILGVGEVWLMTTKVIETIPFTFIREARKEVAYMNSLFPSLIGITSCDYKSAIKFVQLLGFKMTEEKPFVYFSMEKS